MSSLFDICPRGAWVSEDRAVTILGLSSKDELKEAFNTGSLPHVFVEHGKRYDVTEPYNKHRFFFIQQEGTTCSRPSVNLGTWVNMCQSLEGGIDSISPPTEARVKEYTKYTNMEDAYRDLKSHGGIVSTNELTEIQANDDGGYRYGTNGGKMLAPSKANSFSASASASEESEIYVRADGKKVRRVKRQSSDRSAPSKSKSLGGFLDQSGKDDSKLSKLSGSRSVGGGVDGEIYVRADGKKGKFDNK